MESFPIDDETADPFNAIAILSDDVCSPESCTSFSCSDGTRLRGTGGGEGLFPEKVPFSQFSQENFVLLPVLCDANVCVSSEGRIRKWID